MSGSTKGTVYASKVTTPTDREILIERIFDAPRDRVWRAFTEFGGYSSPQSAAVVGDYLVWHLLGDNAAAAIHLDEAIQA